MDESQKKKLIGLYLLSAYMRVESYRRIDWVATVFREQEPDVYLGPIQTFLINYIRAEIDSVGEEDHV